MYVFIREPKFSSIGYKVGARFRLTYQYINIPSLLIIHKATVTPPWEKLLQSSHKKQSINVEFA
jgi:hypothetical protein